ncbi:mechanosensitive ion channel family protein [Pontibacter harenae]|uniref:mechanosensitive ion channel family protein n=1 Tax=Pontibacter harenae TaxID=2894083 RepID=UPI001E5B68A3|nr:mechanosensitive ion channel family protein [Pontibacter harenae]MCC9168555.1 mechanosensitive ion channel family protein [Pontibacter harenae]
MRKFSQWFENVTGLTGEFQEHLLFSLGVLVSVWLLGRLLIRIVMQRQPDLRKQYQWRKTINYITTGLAVILLANIWFTSFQPIATFLGLLSAGLVVGLREPLLNMAGWLFIIWKRPFRIGDRVQVGEHIGDVIDVRLFQFSLSEIQQWVEGDQPTGRVVHIPNGRLFIQAQSNYNYGFPFIWNEITVHLTFESNWQKAKSILMAVAQEHIEHLTESAEQQVRKESQRHLIFFESLDPKLYTKVDERGIQLTLRYMCSLMRRRQTEHLIWEDLLQRFLTAPDIQFAYPTTRFYSQSGPGAAGEPKV